MNQVSQKWREYYDSGRAAFEYRLNIDGADYTGDSILDLSLTGGLCGGDKLTVGNVCMRELSFTLLAETLAPIPKRARAALFVRLNGADGPAEWLQKGEFFVDRRALGKEGARFICCDRVVMMSAPFLDSERIDGYPMPMTAAIQRVCARAGLTLDNPEDIPPFAVEYPNELTLREVAGYIAAAGGGNFTVTDAGRLRLVTPRNGPPVFDASEKAFSEVNDAYRISAVTMRYDDRHGFQAGDVSSSGRELDVFCPWATQDMCDFVMRRLGGYSHAPFTASGVFMDPAVELGDAVTLLGTENGIIFSADIRLGADAVWRVSSPGSGALEHEFPYEGDYARALGRKVTLGEAYEGVVISRRDGIVIRYTDGSAEVQFKSGSIAMRALRGGVMEDVLYFDSAKRTYVFDGELTANVIKALEALLTPEAYVDSLYADNGAIAALTVNRLRTDWEKPFRYLRGDASDMFYLDVYGEQISFIEARCAGGAEQYTTLDGRPLYWRDQPGGLMTTAATFTVTEPPEDFPGEGEWAPVEAARAPVTVYTYEEVNPGGFAFQRITGEWGSAQTPVLTFGRGDADGRKKGRVYKDDAALRIEYDHPDGDTYYLEIGDEGIKANPPLTSTSAGHLVLGRPPVAADLDELPEGGVVLVYDPGSPLRL